MKVLKHLLCWIPKPFLCGAMSYEKNLMFVQKHFWDVSRQLLSQIYPVYDFIDILFYERCPSPGQILFGERFLLVIEIETTLMRSRFRYLINAKLLKN